MRVTLYTPILSRPRFHGVIAELVRRQTYPIHEHIIVEEQWSYDAHGAPIPDATYILPEQQHVSIGNKSNFAHAAATGDLLLSWSSDDYFEKDYVQRMVDIFLGEPHIEVVGFSTQRLYDLPRKHYRTYRKGNNGGNFAYRRDYFERPPFTDSSLGEDVAFFRSIPPAELLTTDYLEGSFCAIRHGSDGDGRHACAMKPTGKPDHGLRVFNQWFRCSAARALYHEIMEEAA